jgi:hypothetical protein
MNGLRVLITNTALLNRAGTEMYIRDVATALLARGHSPFVYSNTLGSFAEELRGLTIPVVDNLNVLDIEPNIIHGQHHLETMTALLRFPRVPAVYFCHGWLPWEEAPPRFPRILRYVAVDHTVRDRLQIEHGIPESRVEVLFNFVDLDRFKPRDPLPARPTRALVFSNQASEQNYLPIVRAACASTGIHLDVIGVAANSVSTSPEESLPHYDLVFAKGRAALEALATGAAVVLCDAVGAGPMVTSKDLESLRVSNFGIRTLQQPMTPQVLIREIERYDPVDAANVCERIRETAGRDPVIDAILRIYAEVIAEYRLQESSSVEAESRAAADYLRNLSKRVRELEMLASRVGRSPFRRVWKRVRQMIRRSAS